MKKLVLIAAACAVVLALCGAVAQAQASAPANQLLGPYAQNSAKYAEYLAKCDASDMTPRQHDQAARLVEVMSPDQLRLHILNCPKVAAKKAPAVAQVYGRGGAEVEVGVGRPPRAQTQRSRGGNNYAEVRAYLKNYKGPLWKTQDPILNVYKNQPAPEGAVPCRPPGYNHTVLCNPR